MNRRVRKNVKSRKRIKRRKERNDIVRRVSPVVILQIAVNRAAKVLIIHRQQQVVSHSIKLIANFQKNLIQQKNSTDSDSNSRSKKKEKKIKPASSPKRDLTDYHYGQNYEMDDHELKVKKFLEMGKDEDDYEDKVGQLLAEASKYQKSKQAEEAKQAKKKKKSDKKLKKE